MPLLTRDDGIEIFWEERGSDSGPSVILAPYCISHPSVFDPLEAELAPDHRIVRYDDRGSGASTHRGPYDMETGAADLEAVLEAAGRRGGRRRTGRLREPRRPGDREPTRPGGGARRARAATRRAAARSRAPTRWSPRTAVVDAFMSMVETDYRGAVRTAGHRRKPADERGRGPGAGRAAGRVSAPGRRREPPAGLDGGRRRRTPGASAAIGCGSCTPTTRAGAGSRPATKAGTRSQLFPEAHVERIENGIISRPDLTAAAVRRAHLGLRLESGA